MKLESRDDLEDGDGSKRSKGVAAFDGLYFICSKVGFLAFYKVSSASSPLIGPFTTLQSILLPSPTNREKRSTGQMCSHQIFQGKLQGSNIYI